MKRTLTVLALFTSALFASDGTTDYDILPRTVNFILFVAIMYYLVADKVKAFFTGRTQEIQDEHDKVQARLKQTRLAKQEAEQRVKDAKQTAKEYLETSKKENDILSNKIAMQMEQDIKNMIATFTSTKEYEQSMAVQSVVDEVLQDVMSDDKMPLKNDAITKIIMKKVA